jgi:DNA-binding SARP family transcriptional activator
MLFSVLGPLQIRHRGALLPITAAKQRIVLATLLLRGNRVVSFDELVDAVWDGPGSGAERATVRNYIKRLRQALGPEAGARIVTRDPGYLIEVSTAEVDLLQFAAMSRAGVAAAHEGAWCEAADTLRTALDLWRGAALADIPSPRLHRERVPQLEESRLHALEWRIEAELNLGRHRQAVTELSELVAAHPLRERLQALLMLALYRDGRQAEALTAYQLARRRLIDELGVEPGPQLREVHRRILAGDADLSVREPAPPPAADPAPAAAPPRTPVVPRQLPPRGRYFVGREGELKSLMEFCATSPGAAVCAVVGMAGIGKSALAVHWAHQVAERFPDGQLYANLRGFDPCDQPAEPEQVMRDFLEALQVPPDAVPAALPAQAALYRSLLADKRVLVLLDNARDAAQVRPLLPGGAGCTAMVTSRSQLAGLVASEGAELLTLDLLSDAEANELLGWRLGPHRVAQEPEAVRELVRLCARLPLAVSIAAARAAAQPAFPLATLAAELRDTRNRLDALEAGEAVNNVRAVLSWSYRHLSAPAARLFRVLGLHSGPDIALPAVASLAGLPKAEAGELIRELTRAHLVEEPSAGRYSFHDLLRAYAAEQAEADTEADRRAALRRLLDHYLHSAHAADRRLIPQRDPITPPAPAAGVGPEVPADAAQAQAWFEAERHVLLATVPLAAAVGFDVHAWQIPWSLATALDWCGHWHDLGMVQEIALAAAVRLGDRDGQARAHRSLGHARTQLGRYDDAYAHTVAALEIFTVLGDIVAQAQTHLALAWTLAYQQRVSEALEHTLKALDLSQAVDAPSLQADVLNTVGWRYSQLGDHAQALVYCEVALSLFRQLGDPDGEANTLDSLGRAHLYLGHHRQAVLYYQQAEELFGRLGSLYSQAATLTCLGEAHDAAGDLRAARRAWREGLAIMERLAHPDAARLRMLLRDSDSMRSAREHRPPVWP